MAAAQRQERFSQYLRAAIMSPRLLIDELGHLPLTQTASTDTFIFFDQKSESHGRRQVRNICNQGYRF
jgi:hypothetical protein